MGWFSRLAWYETVDFEIPRAAATCDRAKPSASSWATRDLVDDDVTAAGAAVASPSPYRMSTRAARHG
jgi:hypothetical protein